MEKGLFTLSPGDKFELSGNKFEVVRYYRKSLPRIGMTLLLEAKTSENKIQCFTRNFKVQAD